jgi:ribose-phosphate pyrophosphokinase
MVANLLNVAGVNHVITIDLHGSQMQGFFRCPVDNLMAEPLIARWIRHNAPEWQEAVVVSKNPGGTKRVTSLADALKLSFGIVTTDSRRVSSSHLQDSSTHGSVIFERFGADGTYEEEEQEEEGSSEPVRPHESQVNGINRQSENSHESTEHTHHHHHRSRRRTTSNPHAKRVQNQSGDLPSSPLAKSSVPEGSPDRSSSDPNRLARTSTAPEAPVEHFEAQNDEFIDERARDVIQGRLVHGHIVDEEVSQSTMRHSGDRNGSDDDEIPPNMSASILSTTSSMKLNEGALGGSVDAAASDEEQEEELKNPELETTITLVGNVKDRPVFIVDDMIDKSGSWIAAAETCVKRGGATRVYCIATHGLFGDECLDELEDCECIDRIVVTNSFPLPERRSREDTKLTVLDISPLLAEAIRRNHYGESISQLFMHDSWN